MKTSLRNKVLFARLAEETRSEVSALNAAYRFLVQQQLKNKAVNLGFTTLPTAASSYPMGQLPSE